jgi:DNA recombination protein RmuC
MVGPGEPEGARMDLAGLAVAVLAGVLLGLLVAGLRARGAGEARAAAEARLGEALARLDSLQTELETARGAANAAETAAALARQDALSMRERIADWEAMKAEFLKSTQAGVIETAQQISSKLLADHKRETQEAKQQSVEETRAVAAVLQAEVKSLADGVSQLKGQLGEKGAVLDTVWRALSSPGGAGYFAEIGLANTLKSFGLASERDFVLQATLSDAEGQRKRPDALVFLPGESVLVIDAKASKHLLDLARDLGTEREAEAWRSLARTMNQHLKDLADRDYRSAVAAGYRRAGKPGEIARLLTVMYLPNEAALEKIGQADPAFMQKAAQAQILLAGPAGLASIIGFASVEISLMRQIENQERIAAGAERLLESLATALGFAAGVGKGLRGAADAFAKLTSSLNGRVLPRARDLTRLGLRPAKTVPANLASFQVLDLGAETIEGEISDAAEEAALPAPVDR